MQNIFSIVLFQSYTYTSCFRYGPSCFWSFFWHLQNEIRKYICLPMEAYLSPGRMSEVNWPYSVLAVSDSKDTCSERICPCKKCLHAWFFFIMILDFLYMGSLFSTVDFFFIHTSELIMVVWNYSVFLLEFLSYHMIPQWDYWYMILHPV